MPAKRQRPSEDSATDHDRDLCVPRKNQRLTSNPFSRRNPRDRLSSLSDELTLRILSYLSISDLLEVALVSHHFARLASDSQLWRALYYSRFVLPRALRIPGFRDGSRRQGSRLHYSARRAVWADGGRGRKGGGLLDMRAGERLGGSAVDWKRQYRLRHNWARGKATVEELDVCGATSASKRTLAKVVEGIAVTADVASGLRAWDLKTKSLIAQIGLQDASGAEPAPTCLAIDDQSMARRLLDVSIGFLDGSFGVWRLDLEGHKLVLRYRHARSSNGGLIGVAYRHPFLLTATESVLISLYDFDHPSSTPQRLGGTRRETAGARVESSTRAAKLDLGYESDEPVYPAKSAEESAENKFKQEGDVSKLEAPILVTSLRSHTSRAPLALSIRSMAGTIVSSIAYTFSTRGGWSIGVQDLHIQRAPTGTSEVTSTRLAYTFPVTSPASGYSSPPATPSRPFEPAPTDDTVASVSPSRSPSTSASADGPTTLCYTHPYLLATLPDNTLILYVCTSNANSLSVSPGIRLWGHTSGISDAEITSRGKAVSVSCRGEEIRVWELEGRAGGKSIEVRPDSAGQDAIPGSTISDEVAKAEWDDRRNWVGFDDEMVIVLKEARDGRESLMVYDFT